MNPNSMFCSKMYKKKKIKLLRSVCSDKVIAPNIHPNFNEKYNKKVAHETDGGWWISHVKVKKKILYEARIFHGRERSQKKASSDIV